jgi:hypothetical protein
VVDVGHGSHKFDKAMLLTVDYLVIVFLLFQHSQYCFLSNFQEIASNGYWSTVKNSSKSVLSLSQVDLSPCVMRVLKLIISVQNPPHLVNDNALSHKQLRL